jgi:hypothetical protein
MVMEIMFRTTTFARTFAVGGAAEDARSAASAGLVANTTGVG